MYPPAEYNLASIKAGSRTFHSTPYRFNGASEPQHHRTVKYILDRIWTICTLRVVNLDAFVLALELAGYELPHAVWILFAPNLEQLGAPDWQKHAVIVKHIREVQHAFEDERTISPFWMAVVVKGGAAALADTNGQGGRVEPDTRKFADNVRAYYQTCIHDKRCVK